MPESIAEPQPAPPAAPAEPEKDEMPTPEKVDDPGDPVPPSAPIADNNPPAKADEEPPVLGNGFKVGRLSRPKGGLAQVLFKQEGSSFVMRGVHKGQTGTTQDLTLGYDGSFITYEDEDRGVKKVGEISGDIVRLCSEHFVEICHLNFLKDQNKLVVGLTESEFRNYEPEGEPQWQSLVSLANYGIDFSLAGGIFADFRLILKGAPTNAFRLAVKPVSGDIIYKGKTIGNYQKLEMCTGGFKDLCRFVVDQKSNAVNIFFKAKKK